MLAAAGANSKLAAAQWLRQRGADWPAVLQHRDRVWQGDALAWLELKAAHHLLKHSNTVMT
jgi:hypothetical protein